MAIQVRRIVENFPELMSLRRGSGEASVPELRAPENATAASLIFASDLEHLKAAEQGPAKTWVVNKPLEDRVPSHVETLIVSPNPHLSMALVARKFFPQERHHQIIEGEKVHPRAVISPTAKIG